MLPRRPQALQRRRATKPGAAIDKVEVRPQPVAQRHEIEFGAVRAERADQLVRRGEAIASLDAGLDGAWFAHRPMVGGRASRGKPLGMMARSKPAPPQRRLAQPGAETKKAGALEACRGEMSVAGARVFHRRARVLAAFVS